MISLSIWKWMKTEKPIFNPHGGTKVKCDIATQLAKWKYSSIHMQWYCHEK